jgi:hypothetical protein
MFYLTVNNSQTLFHDVNTYSEFYYQLFEPLPATEDQEVTLHFKISVPKRSRRISILPDSDTIVKDNDLNKSNTEQENEQENIPQTKKLRLNDVPEREYQPFIYDEDIVYGLSEFTCFRIGKEKGIIRLLQKKTNSMRFIGSAGRRHTNGYEVCPSSSRFIFILIRVGVSSKACKR